jgi:hypothetical protein
MACCDECEKTGGSCGESAGRGCMPKTTALGASARLGDDTAVAATPTPWGSIAVGFLAGGLTVLALKHFGVIRINPAHEDFVGRRVMLPSGDTGVVKSVKGDMLSVQTRSGQLARARKDRVTLI